MLARSDSAEFQQPPPLLSWMRREPLRRSQHHGSSATRADERCRGPASLSGSSGECSHARLRRVATRAGVLRKRLVFIVAAPPDARLVAALGGAVEPLVHAPEGVQAARV